jgi:retron-type reverse transcriptase
MSAQIVVASWLWLTWRDWKGDLVPYLGALFGKPIRIDIPAEFGNATTLLAYLGLGTAELKKIWYYRVGMYRHFSIVRSPHKVRMISAPDDRLKFLQRKLADKLTELYRPRDPVHGFVAKRSVKTNAQAHLRRRFVVNLDLKDFFPSISQNRIEGMLSSLGLDSRVAKIIAHICCVKGHLPQGAPSSPVLSNMLCFRLDKNLMSLAKEARCIYTRYADDITFSSHQPPTALFETIPPAPGRLSPDLFAPSLRGVILQNGFEINPEKAHYADRHSRRVVTGLKVNELLNVDRSYVRNIRAALHSIEVLGLVDAEKKFHASHGGSGPLEPYLRGKISFLTHVKGQTDPVVRGITLRFNKCFPARPIRIAPSQEEILDRAVWVVKHEDGKLDERQGTAFFLKGVGLVTAAHCVEGVVEAELLHPSKLANIFKVRVSRWDKDRDLAILEHAIPETEYFELNACTKPIATGHATSSVGYPKWGFGDRLNIRPGVVSTVTVKSAVRLIEVMQQHTPGMSGGPLLDSSGTVAGIIHKGGPDLGRNFAVHIEVLSDWLKKI